MPRPHRETAAERLIRLRALHCGECRASYPGPHAADCDPARQRVVAWLDLVRRDHNAGLHVEPLLDCVQCPRPSAPKRP